MRTSPSSAAVIPFPRTRNKSFIVRHASRMAEFNPDAGERHLQRLLEQQCDTMRRRGVPEPVITEEARAVEAAIRATLWNLVMRNPGGVA